MLIYCISDDDDETFVHIHRYTIVCYFFHALHAVRVTIVFSGFRFGCLLLNARKLLIIIARYFVDAIEDSINENIYLLHLLANASGSL